MDVTILPAGGGKLPGEEHAPNTIAGHDRPAKSMLPDTVTARILVANLAQAPLSGGWGSSVATIVVSDDRGTAMGWEVLVSAEATQPAWRPVLVSNRPDTISWIAPIANAGRVPEMGLVNGHSLGPLKKPACILQAWPGGGHSLFVQQLAITYRDLPVGAVGTVLIHLPFAP